MTKLEIAQVHLREVSGVLSVDATVDWYKCCDALILEAKREAWEEAARLAEDNYRRSPGGVDTGAIWSQATATDIASAIRSLAQKEKL